MEERKDIERLFQETFKNFETTPNPEVWNAIENKLKKKRTKRVLPIWWLTSGLAASLIIGFLLFDNSDVENIEVFEETPVVIEDVETKVKIIEDSTKTEDAIPTEIVFNTTRKEVNTENKSKNKKIIDSGLTEKKIAIQKREEKSDDKKEGFLSDQKNAMKKLFSKENKGKTIETLVAENDTALTSKKQKDFIVELKKLDSIQIKATNNEKKWTITPTFGVLSANSFSKASPLDQNLTANTSGSNSISFGVKVGFKLNDKWSIQSGIYQQNIDFSANNLTIVSNIAGSNLDNIKYNSDVPFIISNQEMLNDIAILSGGNLVTQEATLQQTFGYIEVPIEVKYTVMESSRFNTKLISGFSTLLLNKNILHLQSSSITRTIGEATNLNSVNFSGNIGFDINYSLNENFNLNVTPMFKVQLNTFSNSANGFKPYTIGVYSGLSYKF